MAVERTGFEILMTADSSAVVKSSKDAAEALKGTAGATGELNEKLTEAKPKLEEHAQGLEEGGKHAELFGEHHEEAHAAVHALGDIIPGVTGLAREMFSVETLGIGLVGMLISGFIERWEELSETQQKALEDAAKGIGTMKQLQEEARQDAARTRGELQAELDKGNEALTSLEEMGNRRVAIYEAQTAAARKLAAAQDELAKQHVRDAEQSGMISHEDAGRQMERIEQSAERRNASLDQGSEKFRAGTMQAELDSAKARTQDAAKAVADAQAVAADIQLQLKVQASVLASLTDGMPEFQKKVHDADDELTKASAAYKDYASVANKFWVKDAQEAFDAAVAARDRNQKLLDQTRNKQEGLNEALPSAQSGLGSAKAQLDQYENLQRTLPALIEQAKKIAQIHADSERDVQAAQDADALARNVQAALESHHGDLVGSKAGRNDRAVDSRLVDIIHNFFKDHPDLNGESRRQLAEKLNGLERELKLMANRANMNRPL